MCMTLCINWVAPLTWEDEWHTESVTSCVIDFMRRFPEGLATVYCIWNGVYRGKFWSCMCMLIHLVISSVHIPGDSFACVGLIQKFCQLCFNILRMKHTIGLIHRCMTLYHLLATIDITYKILELVIPVLQLQNALRNMYAYYSASTTVYTKL